jgi:hypothetical protein
MANRVVSLELHSDYCGNCAVCAGRQVGVNDERERIIGLLEPLGACEPAICGKGCRGEHRCIGWAYRHAIRLIKGAD